MRAPLTFPSAKRHRLTLVKLSVRLRTGDWAIAIGAAAIAAYEVIVRDDEDLISCRVAAYRSTPAGRLCTDAVIAATVVHLCEFVEPRFDIYHYLMRVFRPAKLADALDVELDKSTDCDVE